MSFMKIPNMLIGAGLIALSIILHSCKKDKATPPTLTTAQPTEITQTSVTSGGNISSDGGEEIIVAGVCWSTSANPTVENNHTNDLKELGNYASKLTGLTPNTKYYIKAYAYNKAGTGYGNEVSFTTSPVINATLTTTDITSITSSTAVSGGNITSDGGGAITARGACWSTSQNLSTADSKTSDGTGTGTFTSNLTGLRPNTTYFVKAYATNSAGTSYGNELSFVTLGQAPSALTQPACCISATGATLNGTVNPNYLSTTVTFEYGTTAEYGNTVTATQSPVSGNSPSSMSASITGLNPVTTYHYRIKAVNSLGSSTGDDITFTTLPRNIPVITTATVASITPTSAVSGGNITVDGGEAITARGICWNTTGTPTISDGKTLNGSGSGIFTSNITGLTPGTNYLLRAYATNSFGTFYGDEKSFITPPSLQSGPIIANHTIVADYAKIPTYYINEVKKMLFTVAGESHSNAFIVGLDSLEARDAKYQVNLSWIPEEYTTSHLRLCQGEWGDIDHPNQWVFSYGEEDWYKSGLAISTTKNGITYINETLHNPLTAMALAWCWDTGETDMAPYLSATQEYNDYCVSKGYPTKIIYTTGPVDNYNASGSIGYNKYLAYEAIRNYVKGDSRRILFDYADILCYDDGSETPNTTVYDGKTYPIITRTNLGDGSVWHISAAGCLRLAKATWWMLARIAGWDGN